MGQQHYWVDAHTHLDSDELYPCADSLLLRAEQAGVRRMVLANSEATEQSFERTLSLVDGAATVARFASLGIHPHHASSYTEVLQENLLVCLNHPCVVAYGEIGLDFYYNFSPPDVQVQVFRGQLRAALNSGLPVVIHCRDAYGQLAEILRSEQDKDWKGMIHCFTGSVAEVEQLLNLGFFISFSGIVTFKKAQGLREAARIVPINRMLTETDAPYLAPVPYRGKTNEPAFVAETGRFLASVKQMEVDRFASQIWENFQSIFPSVREKGR